MHGDGAEDPPFVLELQLFLGLDGRLETIGPLTFFGDPAGVLIHEFDPAPTHDVVAVALEEMKCVEGVS